MKSKSKTLKQNKDSFEKSIIYLILSQVFIKIVGLLYKLYLTNKEGFGDTGNAIYSGGFQIYALLLTFSSTGVPNAISKLVAERLAVGDSKGAHKIFKISLILFAIIGLVGTIILFLGARIISQNLIQIPEAESSLICLAPSIFFVSIISVFRGYFNGRQNFSITAKSQGMEQLFKTLFTMLIVELVTILVTKNIGIMAGGANLATTIATIMSFVYVLIYYKIKRPEIASEIAQTVNYTPTRIRKTLKQILKVAFPISMGSLISSFGKNIDSITVVRFLKRFLTEEEAKVQYGILSGKIDSLCALAYSFNIAFVTVFVPSISKSIARKEMKTTIKKIKIFILITIIIAIPITLIMYIFSNQIIHLLFPKASLGGEYLKLSSLAIVFMLLSQTINAILQALGKVNITPISFGLGMLCKLFCNIILIPNYKIGIFGAIIGNIICNVAAFIFSSIMLFRTLSDYKLEKADYVNKPKFYLKNSKSLIN